MQARIELYGKVQGVGFRMWVKELAEQLELKGYVKNNKEGGVEIVAEGRKKDIEELIRACEIGPTLARVNKMIYQYKKEEGYKDFRIEV